VLYCIILYCIYTFIYIYAYRWPLVWTGGQNHKPNWIAQPTSKVTQSSLVSNSHRNLHFASRAQLLLVLFVCIERCPYGGWVDLPSIFRSIWKTAFYHHSWAWATFPLIFQSLCAHKISFVQHFITTHLYFKWVYEIIMCKNNFGRKIYVHSSLCALVSLFVCTYMLTT